MADSPDKDPSVVAMDSLRSQLAIASVFATLAERHRKSGRHKAADSAVADAERGFEEVVRFLYNPGNAEYMSASDRSEIRREIRRLRRQLDLVKVLEV